MPTFNLKHNNDLIKIYNEGNFDEFVKQYETYQKNFQRFLNIYKKFVSIYFVDFYGPAVSDEAKEFLINMENSKYFDNFTEEEKHQIYDEEDNLKKNLSLSEDMFQLLRTSYRSNILNNSDWFSNLSRDEKKKVLYGEKAILASKVFEDVDLPEFLNLAPLYLGKKMNSFNTKWRKEYLEKFYQDDSKLKEFFTKYMTKEVRMNKVYVTTYEEALSFGNQEIIDFILKFPHGEYEKKHNNNIAKNN